MAEAVAHPTIVIGVGRRGARVIRDLSDTAAVRPSGARFASVLAPGGERGGLLLRRSLEPILAELLEAGRVSREGRAELDLAIVTDLAEGTARDLREACAAVTLLLSESYGVLFPASAPPDKRSVWLTVLVATPPLMSGATGEHALGELASLEDWARTAPHPALTRLWVLPRQTTAGQLSDDAVEQSLRLFLQGLFLSGVRGHDTVRCHLNHRSDGRVLSTVSVAAAELPVARVRQYARWRAAWEGFTTLVHQAEHPSTDLGRLQGLMARLDVKELLRDLEEGEAARDLRAHASTLTGLTNHLPEHLKVGLLESDAGIRERYPVLFVPPREEDLNRPLAQAHADLLRKLDQVEMDAVEETERRVANLLDTELDPTSALQVLPDLESALKRSADLVGEITTATPPTLPQREVAPPPDDPSLLELEERLRSRPRIVHLLPVAGAIGAILGLVAALVVLVWIVPPSLPSVAAPAAFASGTAPVAADPMRFVAPSVGAVLGLATFAVWVALWLLQGRARLLYQLRMRRHTLEEQWNLGGGGRPGRQAQALLDVRRRRLASSQRRVLDAALGRLAALRAALRQARTRALDHLEHLGIHLAEAQRLDDLSDLLGEETPLHRSLLDPSMLAERVSAARTTPDRDRWAELLLESTWPRKGIADDLPAIDEAPIAAICDAQFEDLAGSRLIQGPTVRARVEERLSAFLDGASGALAFGVRPLDTHLDPVGQHGQEDPLVIAPVDLRAVVESGLATHGGRLRTAWGAANTPWVLVVRTWEGLTTEEIGRGMGVLR